MRQEYGSRKASRQSVGRYFASFVVDVAPQSPEAT
jgi:hypothetical protein